MYSKRLLHWLELADIAPRKKPKATTYKMIEDLPFEARKFSDWPVERSLCPGEKFAFCEDDQR
jgi:hypothetical protein